MTTPRAESSNYFREPKMIARSEERRCVAIKADVGSTSVRWIQKHKVAFSA
jgi:hypothetical protein